jgi:hypothetical protein
MWMQQREFGFDVASRDEDHVASASTPANQRTTIPDQFSLTTFARELPTSDDQEIPP